MRKTSENPASGRTDEIRATFVAPRDLIDELRLIAKRNQRTLSGELRKMIDDAVTRERDRSAA